MPSLVTPTMHPSALTSTYRVPSPSTPAASKPVMDPETLFETRTVDEIATFSRSLSQDIDRKREELRTMVGERYRDLMEAADTITHMKESAENVIETVEGVIGKSCEIQAKALLGFQTPDPQLVASAAAASDDPNEPYLAVAAEIKLLMMAPEMIWSAVDQGDFLTAVQLFLFARHIHTSLSLDPGAAAMSTSMTSSTLSSSNGPMSSPKIVANFFPVVSRQWASIAHFHEAILHGCEEELYCPSVGEKGVAERAVRAMAAMVLLKGLSAEEIFTELLSLKKRAVEKQLKESKEKETAKVMIGQSLKGIMDTVSVLHLAFVESRLMNIMEDLKTPTLSLFQTRLSPVFKHLPAIIKDFCPTLIQPIEALSPSLINHQVTAWLDQVHELLSQQTSDILTHVNNIPALSGVRRHCYDLLLQADGGNLKPERWNQLCKDVVGKEVNLWNEFYRGLFRDRIESLIASSIAGAVYLVQSSLATKLDLDHGFGSELDLSEYLWSESNLNEVTSLPKFSAAPVSNPGVKKKPSSLELKAQGFSPPVQELCHQFDELLEKLLNDLEQFIREKEILEEERKPDPLSFLVEPKAQELEPFDLSSDNTAILQFTQDNIVSQVHNLDKHINEKHVDEGMTNRGLMLFLGRFYQALPELCLSLERCVLAPQTLAPKKDMMSFSAMQQRRTMTAVKADPKWAEIKSKFEQESCKLFKLWISSLTKDLEDHLMNSLTDDPATLLKIFALWDTIEISEEAEDGTIVQSKIQVPQHPSVVLSCGLANFCSSVYTVAPYSLPSTVQLCLSQEPAAVVCRVYKLLAQREKLPQMVALQLHFDLQFISQCIITRDNRDLATENQGVLASLESHIDPFDLSVFSPYVTNHVKRSVLRQHGLFSLLIPSDRYALLASMKSSLPTPSTASSSSSGSTPATQEQHNTMWTAPNRPEKIPLIPVPRRKREREPKRMMTSVNSLSASTATGSVSPVMGRRRRDKSPVTKAAGSFFEAMSTSWFGGK